MTQLVPNKKDESGMFELLCDRAVNELSEADSTLNSRQLALQEIIEQYSEHPETLSLLRDRAEKDPDETVRTFALQAVVTGWKDDPETLPWLKKRVQSDKSFEVVNAAVEALARDWNDDPATLNWFKTYTQYSQNVAVRRAAITALGKGWSKHFNVFEILCKCAVCDPFVRKEDSEINPRQIALAVIIEQYPDYPQTLRLLRQLVKQDADVKVREFIQEKLNHWPESQE